MEHALTVKREFKFAEWMNYPEDVPKVGYPECGQRECEPYSCPAGCEGSSNGTCVDNVGTFNFPNWDPDSEVTYANGVYGMGYGFAYNVIAHPSPIHVCDASAVTLTSSGVEISGASAGELIYELGLRNGDKLQEIDGYPLYDRSDVGYAYLVLRILGGDTAYELDILRGTTPMTLNYEFIATL